MLAHLSPYLDRRWYQWNKTVRAQPTAAGTTGEPAFPVIANTPSDEEGQL
jgi:hypothetical protein